MNEATDRPIDLAGAFCRLGDERASAIVARTGHATVRLALLSESQSKPANEAGEVIAVVLEGTLRVVFGDRSESVGEGQMLVIPDAAEYRMEPEGGVVRLLLIQPPAMDDADGGADEEVGSAPSLSSS